MKFISFIRNPYFRLLINILYAAAHCTLGFYTQSWWFITIGAYYAVLSVTRFCMLSIKRKAKGEHDAELFATWLTGILLILLSVCIVGINILCAVKGRGTAFHEIVMIAIATYTFTKITVAIVGMVKAKKNPSPVIKTLRNISLSDACVSIYSMQRSMLVSFPGMEEGEIQLFNIFTGTAVWIVVLLLGINLIGGKHVNMAKSKIADTTSKIAEKTTDGYKKIEEGVVRGYKKIEGGVVDTYKKIEDRFVDAYLTKDGETVEEAKERLKKENK